MHKFGVLSFLLLAAALAFLAGCAPKQNQESSSPPVEEKRYSMKGKVLKVDVPAGVATIDHEEIPGWMEAMTMNFPIQDRAELNKIKPGDTITATVIVRGYDYYLTGIEVLPPAPKP